MSDRRSYWWPAYVGIGSNLNSPLEQVRRAIAGLGEIPETQLQCVSSLYRSAPMGPDGQDDYVNAVAALLTRLEADKLLIELRKIEDGHGRDRTVGRWGPRTLDLDLLVFGGIQMETAELSLPHPGIAQRNFVLLPLAELAPNMTVPGVGTVRQLVRSLAKSDAGKARIEKLSSSNP